MSQIALISIGSELTKGQTLNTNSHLLAGYLRLLGFEVLTHITIGDDEELLKEALNSAFQRCQSVVISGGLGPTGDDSTKAWVSDYLGIKRIKDPVLSQELISRFGALSSIEEQSEVIEGCKLLENKIGTAYGQCICFKEKSLVLLPGIPAELESMLEPLGVWLKKELGSHELRDSKTLYFMNLSEVEIDPFLVRWVEESSDRSYGIYPSFGLLRIYLEVEAKDKEGLSQFSKELEEKFSDFYLPLTSGDLSQDLLELYTKHSLTFSSVESCTSGMIPRLITKTPGSSSYFLGGVVSYSNRIKEQLVHVSAESLKEWGAVSKQVAIEMAEGGLRQFSSDCSISTTGIAGPGGGSSKNPVGTIYIAFAQKGFKTEVLPLSLKGSRYSIIKRVAHIALAYSYKILLNRLS